MTLFGPIDSYGLIKRASIPCSGGCERILADEMVVLEFRPTGTLLFLCPACASNRLVLDAVAARLSAPADPASLC